MSTLKIGFRVLVFTLLTSCASQPIHITATDSEHQGLVVLNLQFSARKQNHQWVCYVELFEQQITGMSCQNDTALTLFSGGLVNGAFVFNYPSRYLLKIPPNHVLSYLKMALFNNLDYNQNELQTNKTNGMTTIHDKKNKVHMKVQIL